MIVFNLDQIAALPVTADEIAATIRYDLVLSKVYTYIMAGWPKATAETMQPYQLRAQELTTEGHCLMWGIRVTIPSKQREQLMHEFHRDHPGSMRMKSLARSYFW